MERLLKGWGENEKKKLKIYPEKTFFLTFDFLESESRLVGL